MITDYADNLQRLGRIMAAMDVSNASDVEVIIRLKNAIASDRHRWCRALMDRPANGAAGGRPGRLTRSRPPS